MMRSFFKKCTVFALSAAYLTGAAQAQNFGAPSVLPPAVQPAGYTPQIAAVAPSVAPTQAAPGYGGYGAYADQPPVMIYEGAPGAAAPQAYGSVVYEGDHGCGLAGWMDALCRQQTCWFGGVRGLTMDLLNQDRHWFSYDDINLERQILHHEHANMDWSGGVEARIGRYFHCGQTAVELIYWGIYPSEQEASRTRGDVLGTLNHTFTFNSLSYDDGLGGGVQALDGWFNDAEIHRVRRDWQFHNVEVNVLNFRNSFMAGCGVNGTGCGPAARGLGCWDACSPRLNLSFLAGFRYFRFDEGLQFASDDLDTVFDGDPNEIYYDVDVKNELYGFQLGGAGEYFLTRRWSLAGGTKFGVYENHIRQRQRIGGAAGDAFVNDPISPNNGLAYNVRSSEDDIAFLGEIETAVNYYLTSNLRLTGGYRVVAATGVARTTDQIPYNFDDLVGATDIDTRGCMVLHGAFGGVEFNY